MATLLKPLRGQWYKRQDLNALFEVVAIDRDEATIEIQYFNGEIEEFDFSNWAQLEIVTAAPPEDWSGALEVESYAINDTVTVGPDSLEEALNILDVND